ncbi:thiamine-phosphate kinase [Lentisphaerota bacterium WC36G]|nr:thiamine-phosphate kinase [Lentisphaerae bacterium WC36]
MNENNLIKFLIPKMAQSNDVIVPPGDDCAVVKIDNTNVLMAVDQVISTVHYTPETDAKLIAEKLLKRNLSDIAAMGGVPTHAVMTIASNRSANEWYYQFYQAMANSCQKFNIAMVGGDLAKSTAKVSENDCIIEVCTITIYGKMTTENILLRNNAQANDIIFVTGKLGNSFHSNHHLTFTPRLKEGLFLAENNFSKCAMDISDGLILDAKRIAVASNCVLQIDEKSLPLRKEASTQMALTDGEDYELIFTISPHKITKFVTKWAQAFPHTELTKIGKIIKEQPKKYPNKVVINENGAILSENDNIGFIHRD